MTILVTRMVTRGIRGLQFFLCLVYAYGEIYYHRCGRLAAHHAQPGRGRQAPGASPTDEYTGRVELGDQEEGWRAESELGVLHQPARRRRSALGGCFGAG